MTRIDRRGLLRGAAATAGVALASPYLARGAMAQGAGQVNIFAWAGYLNDEILGAFQEATGITPNFTPYGTNDELLNQLRANNGAGFDPAERPTRAHLGVDGMLERAELVGGTLSVTSTPGAGTTVLLEVRRG